MTSASILITIGSGEQTKVHSASDDLFSEQAESSGISFEKTFNERVGVASFAQGENTTGEAAIALPGLKSITLAKKLNDDAGIPNEVKGTAVSVQQRSVHGKLKNVVGGEIPHATTGMGSEEKTAANDSAMKAVGLPAQAEEIADDVSSNSSIPYAKPADGATHVGSMPQNSIADGDHPLVLRSSEQVVLKATKPAETAKEVVSTKKAVMTEENEATPKCAQKTVGVVVTPIAVEVKPVAGTSADAGIPLAGQMVAPPSEKKEISKAADDFGRAVSAVSKASTAVSPATVDGLVRKDPVAGVKTSVTDSQMTATSGNDLVAPPKGEVSPEKVAAIGIPGGSDGENKLKSAPVIGAALLHSMGIEPTAIAPGNTPGELGAIKLPVGDAAAHPTGLSTGMREPDAPGVVAQSMEGAPRLLTATSTSLEVGIQNGIHGWLKVRAEMTDGVVNASVAAASSAGQEMLHRELPALTAYLQEEKVAMNAVVIHAPTAAGTDARGFSGMNGTGGGTPQRNDEGGAQQNLRKATLDGFGEATTYRRPDGIEEDGTLSLAAYARGGSWLSVRA